jgi:hypothetical protein
MYTKFQLENLKESGCFVVLCRYTHTHTHEHTHEHTHTHTHTHTHILMEG